MYNNSQFFLDFGQIAIKLLTYKKPVADNDDFTNVIRVNFSAVKPSFSIPMRGDDAFLPATDSALASIIKDFRAKCVADDLTYTQRISGRFSRVQNYRFG